MNLKNEIWPYWLFVRALYLTLFVCLWDFSSYTRSIFRESPPALPLWPLELFSFLPFEFLVDLIYYSSFGLCIAAVLLPQSRTLRIGVALSLFYMVALRSSYGKVIHGFHAWMLVTLVFVFLPTWKQRNKDRFAILHLILLAQFVSVFPYAMAGLWKLRLGASCLIERGSSCLMDAMPHVIGWEHVIYGYEPSASALFFLNHAYISALAFLGLVFLQALSPLVVFVPRAHLLFGLAMSLFHILSDVALRLPFHYQFALIAVLFIPSPFQRFGEGLGTKSLLQWIRGNGIVDR